MTTRATDDPLPRDSRFDAAWRTASSEEPPPALDAAILAAAHREVAAKPQSLSAHAAIRARRRWWPLAAAATVAAIAIGVVQRVGYDDLVAPPSGSAVVSDMPAQSATSVAEPGQRTEAQRRGVPSEPAPLRKKAEPVASAPEPTEKRSEAVTSAPAPLPEPFPASRTKLDAAATRDAAAGAPASASAGNIDTAPAPSTKGQASAKLVAPPAPSDSPPMPPATAPMPPAASFAESARVAPSAPARQSPAARSALAGASQEAPIKDHAPLPVADWIALIRRLRAEGNAAEAARELAAFRTAHADHQALLPPDLRDWHPIEK